MYWLYKFGTYEIPRAGTKPENFQIQFKKPELEVFNGSVDLYGSERTGMEVTTISTNGAIGTLTEVKTLRRLIGTKANLTRERDDGQLEYTPARLTDVTVQRVSRYDDAVTVDLTFHIYRPIWYYETANTDNHVVSGATTNYNLDNTESEIEIGGTVTLTANAGATVTNPRITVGTQYVQYTGTMTAGDVVIFDLDGKTITYNGADAYDDLAAANKSTWVQLTPGTSNAVTITCTISGGTMDVDWEWETAVL